MADDEYSRLFVEVPKHVKGVWVSSSNRDPTPEEQEASEERRKKLDSLRTDLVILNKKIQELATTCPHTVVRDQKGYIYDWRECYACGKSLGAI